MTEAVYEARLIESGHERGKWAVFKGDEQHTKGGSETGARTWANFMNRTAT